MLPESIWNTPVRNFLDQGYHKRSLLILEHWTLSIEYWTFSSIWGKCSMLNYQFSMFKLSAVVVSNVARVYLMYSCPKQLSLGWWETFLTHIWALNIELPIAIGRILNIFFSIKEMLNAQLSIFNVQVIDGSGQQCCHSLVYLCLPEAS